MNEAQSPPVQLTGPAIKEVKWQKSILTFRICHAYKCKWWEGEPGGEEEGVVKVEGSALFSVAPGGN